MPDSSTRYKVRLAIAGATVTLLSALGSLGEAADIPKLWLASCAVLIVGALSVLWLTVRDHVATAREQRRDLLELLVTTDPDRVPRLDELSAYELGTDPEAFGSEDPAPYVARDKDDELDDAIERARLAPTPSMVVLRGPSKSGKSRALYESVQRSAALRGAYVLAPRDRDALARLLDQGPPAARRGQLVLWLDDLERFVSAGHEGMSSATLDVLRGWQRPVVVVATAGGKGAELLADGLSVPIRQLYGHRRVTVVSLSSELTKNEQVRVRDRYEPDAAQQIVAHGIGEYLVAAPELARKLDDECHAPGDDPCPEGAAVAWAVIDWARSGMTGSIPDDLLRAVWPLYLRGILPTDEHFERGLEWALKPVYRSVALVYETSSYEPYDWIVAHASSSLTRQINERAWDRMMREVDPAAAFELAVAAYQNGRYDECTRAFDRGTEAEDGLIAANAAFNLGYVLAAQGDVDGACAAYGKAIGSREPEPAAMAGLNLGILLQDQDDLDGAARAYRAAVGCATSHSGTAALNLGLLLTKVGDVDGAQEAFEIAARDEDFRLASRAEFMLGTLLEETRPGEAAEALARAVALGDPEIAPVAAHLRAQLLASSDPAGAPPEESALIRGLRLEEEGDAAGARAAYEQAIASAEGEPAVAATLFLGLLLKRQGEASAARGLLARAAAAAQEDIAHAAAEALDDLSMEGRA